MGLFVGGMRVVALAVPLTGTGFLAINGRVPDSFPNPELGPVLSRKIDAYCEPVAVVQRDIMAVRTAAPATKVEAAASVWIRELKAGHLKPLPSVGESDTTRDGVKSQILNTRNVVIANLIRVGTEARLQGDKSAAIRRYNMALTVSSIARDSDLNALATSLAFENTALRQLKDLGAALPMPMVNDGARYEHLLKREFVHILKQPSITASDRRRMKRVFNLSRVNLPYSCILSTSDYDLSLMLSAARRIETLLAKRSEMVGIQLALNTES